MALFCISISLYVFYFVRVAFAANGNCEIAPLSLPWSNVTVSANGVAVTRGIELGIGTPNQIFSLRPSTTLNNTRLSNVFDCGSEANASCVGGKGGVYDSSKSSTFVVSIKDRWNGSTADTETATGSYVYFNDFIDFRSNGSIWGFPLVEDSDLTFGESSITSQPDHARAMGSLVLSHGAALREQKILRERHASGTYLMVSKGLADLCRYVAGTEAGLPLGQNSSFLTAVIEANLAPSKAWGLWAGDRSLSPADGALTIGGYEPARVAGEFTTFPLGDWSLQQPCPLQITIRSILYNRPNGISESLTSENIIACIEPFHDHLTFTPAVAAKFANVTSYNSSYPGLTYPTDRAPDGDLVITLENNYTTVVPNSELVTLKRGSDQLGHYAITNSSIVETEIVYNAQGDPTTVQPILGGTYLTFNYLVVDYESGQFQLAPAVQGNQPTGSQPIKAICTQTPITNNRAGDSSSKIGAIVGGTVGGVIGLAVIGGLVLLFRRHRHPRQHPQGPESMVAPCDRTAQWTASVQTPTLSEKETPQWPSELPLSLATSVHEMPASPKSNRISRALTLNRRSQTT